jgi:hypothetical protein
MDKLSNKLAVAAVLVAITVIRWPAMIAPSYTIAMLAFGLVNVFLALPGTGQVRAATIVTAVIALMAPPLQLLVAVGAWLLWLPAFAASYAVATARQRGAGDDAGDGEGNGEAHRTDQASKRRQAQLTAAATIAAAAVASLAYRVIVSHNLQQTAVLFVGIPALIAVVIVFAVSPDSATGAATKAVTIGLLVSLMMLWEGMLCVLFAAPIFYAVAVAVAKGIESARKEQEHRTLYSSLVVLALVPLAIEGATPWTTVTREAAVTVTRVVAAPADAVERALFERPRFERVPSRYLRAGFPSPVAARIVRTGDRLRWTVELRGGEMRLNGMEPRTGDLILDLIERGPGFFRWNAVSDTSHMTHFLSWRGSDVRWEAVDEQSTRVTWTVRYARGLDPAWYFGPLERLAVGLAADYLIESVATP